MDQMFELQGKRYKSQEVALEDAKYYASKFIFKKGFKFISFNDIKITYGHDIENAYQMYSTVSHTPQLRCLFGYIVKFTGSNEPGVNCESIEKYYNKETIEKKKRSILNRVGKIVGLSALCVILIGLGFFIKKVIGW